MSLKELITNSAAIAELNKAYRLAHDTACEAQIVSKPKALRRLRSSQRDNSAELRALRTKERAEVNKRTQKILQATNGAISSLAATEYAVNSMLIERELQVRGAVYGQDSYNFCLTELRLPPDTAQSIAQAGLEAFDALLSIRPPSIESSETTKTEAYFTEMNLRSNAARVDIILTDQGPQVIELNTQWVDGILAVDAFGVIAGNSRKRTPLDMFEAAFQGRTRLAIVDLTQGSGSRRSGAQAELRSLATVIESRRKLKQVEILDPRKIRDEYFDEFDAFYINGEPSMLSKQVPEWLQSAYRRMQNQDATVLPIWNPAYDRKTILIEASKVCPHILRTLPFSSLQEIDQAPYVLKGVGYSSKAVAISGSPENDSLIAQASLRPEEFIVQPLLTSSELPPMLAYDSSSRRFEYLTNPRAKFNVWILNGQVAGMLCSISSKSIISDKDYNIAPRII